MGDRVGPLPCFKCDKQLEPVFTDGKYSHQPYKGTLFTTSGHYGSTFVDIYYDSSYIEIVLCDDCLKENVAAIDRVHITESKVTTERTPYDPDED